MKKRGKTRTDKKALSPGIFSLVMLFIIYFSIIILINGFEFSKTGRVTDATPATLQEDSPQKVGSFILAGILIALASAIAMISYFLITLSASKPFQIQQ